jgi:hypothetical protein
MGLVIAGISEQEPANAIESTVDPAVSKADNTMSDKEAAKRKKAQEQEAKRLAEETKKRLAVGRIGTI